MQACSQAAQALPVPPAERWEIDYKALTINQRVGVGSFGEVFKVRHTRVGGVGGDDVGVDACVCVWV